MIITKARPLEEITAIIKPYRKVAVLGCNTCAAVCYSGGEKEVGVLSGLLRLAQKKIGIELETFELCLERQCDDEFVLTIKDKLDGVEAILSLACGGGVQKVAEKFPNLPVYPVLNTHFIGVNLEQGLWAEYCIGCGNCLLDLTGGICPLARCAKSLLNGPCGGSDKGKCEVNQENDCAWHLIYEKLNQTNRLELLEEIQPPRDWSLGRDGGPRKIKREDLSL